MNSKYTIFNVDDVEASRLMIGSMFGHIFNVESFASGEACLERMAERMPDLFLLDVDMPGMDGFTLCRQIKGQFASSTVPVIFVSALDDLESQLSGYDAGGDDFIAKPFRFSELKHKVEVLRRIGEEKSTLQIQLEDSEFLANLVLSNLDEYAVLIKFLRSLNSCAGYRDVADAVLAMLQSYNLEGALQFKLPEFEITINLAGEVSPLEASIINQVRCMGTVATFKNRAAFNFERVSVLVNNMPLADPDRCGRLRDHLAIAIETVNAKLLALLVHQDNAETKTEIAALLQALGATVRIFGEKYEKARYRGSDTTRLLHADLDVSFAQLGMREEHEQSIKNIVQARVDELVNIFDFGAETEHALNDLSLRLGRTLTHSSPENQ
jgi:CheY-like chemotaxis protein